MEENQRHPIIYNVYGGNNILAPNATGVSRQTTKYQSPMDLCPKPFAEIDLSDKFFDSLRASYPGFDDWFRRKAAAGETATTYYEEDTLLDFLYLKEEREEVTDVEPPLPAKHRLKVGTFKIDKRGTRRGERLMKKLLDTAIAKDVDEIYVTIFPEQRLQPLIHSFEKYAHKQSVFTEYELRQWYRMKPHFILIQMVYNIAFTRKVILKDLREQVGLNPNYWGFFRLTPDQFNHIVRLGAINERYLIR